MIENFLEYGDNLEGFYSAHNAEKRPLVLLCHAWSGRDPFICNRAGDLARLGYVGFALDVYGKGVLGKNGLENAALKKPLLEDRELLQERLLAGYRAATSLPFVDPQKIAVVGFGFGGLCALDLARSGVPLQGAVSIYGHFEPPPYPHRISAKILLLHGGKDPIVPLAELKSFEDQLSKDGIDCESQIFEDAMHAFASPSAKDPASGICYHKVAADQAWGSVEKFLRKIF